MYLYFTDFDFRWTMKGGLKMLSIRLDSIESTRIVSPADHLTYRKSIFARLPLDKVGWVKNVVDLTPFDRINMSRTSRVKFLATF